MTVPDIINTAGVSLILLAFLLLNIKYLSSESLTYHLMNLAGAALACFGSYLIRAYPFVFLEGIWALVALTGVIKKVNLK